MSESGYSARWAELMQKENAALKQEIELLKSQRNEWCKRAGQSGKLFTEAEGVIKQLQSDNAALIECVKEVARQSNNHDTTTLKMLARECLSKLGGSPDA